jgi:diketogulonate reductase-like aldo/keto reductase
MAPPTIDRRALLRLGAAAAAALRLPATAQPRAEAAASTEAVPASRMRPIPSSGELLPTVGLGSWITFNVGRDAAARGQCAEVMRAFFAAGGRLIDSSPMYGSSQEVIGEALGRIGAAQRVFAADKVWVTPALRGAAQIETSRALWGLPRFDLLQVHNLLSWQEHLPLLLEMKAAGRVRYVGITTSEGRRLRETEQIMRSHPIDFVQVSYSLADRRVEDRILPLARERGIAVIANRPFEQGELLRVLARHPLPPVAAELQCTNWAEFALKFVVSHPAVTCAIPATTNVAHVRENMAAGFGVWPDIVQRNRMRTQTEKLL